MGPWLTPCSNSSDAGVTPDSPLEKGVVGSPLNYHLGKLIKLQLFALILRESSWEAHQPICLGSRAPPAPENGVADAC